MQDVLSTIFFITGLLICGTANTILTKLQDTVCVKNCDTFPIYFQQPVLQSLNMFVGEILCLIIWYFYEKNEKDTKYILVLFPAFCDSIASTLMNMGLIFVSASIFQMLRGSMVIFTGIISILFLNKHYTLVKFSSLFIIFLGVCIVSTANYSENNSSILGIGLILIAQIIGATQYVYEEKIIITYSISPLLVVGLEGLFATIIILILCIILQITKFNFGNEDDILTGFKQVITYKEIYTPSILILFSICVFNWCGLNITKKLNATSRSTIDISKTIITWILSITLGWEIIKWLQIVGFLIMIFGILLFNNKTNENIDEIEMTHTNISE